ncbi:MAG: alpha-mannosidase, partial [bacterium]|nr:alpha-mannosidase [bacterium]
MRIHLIPNSHIDPVWLWDKYEGIDEVLNTFRSACDRLDEYPDLTFSASSIQFYEWVLKYDPRLFERIQRAVAEDRWELTGGWWVEADTNLPAAASFFKQAELSRAFVREHFAGSIDVAYLPDTFGHPASLPKILVETGFKYFIFCRPNETENQDLPGNLFYWDYEGCRVLAYRLKHHYLQYAVRPPDTIDAEKISALLQDREYHDFPVNCYFFGVGDHGGGPAIAEIECYNHFIQQQAAGDVGYSSCLRFFEEAGQIPNIPVYSGDLHRHAVGCYSVVRDIKHAMRRSEHHLQFASRALQMAG